MHEVGESFAHLPSRDPGGAKYCANTVTDAVTADTDTFTANTLTPKAGNICTLGPGKRATPKARSLQHHCTCVDGVAAADCLRAGNLHVQLLRHNGAAGVQEGKGRELAAAGHG